METRTEEELEQARQEYKLAEQKRLDEYNLKLANIDYHKDEVREPFLELPKWSAPLIDTFYKTNSGYSVFSDVKPGNFFLFQELTTLNKVEHMGRPVLALCVEFDVYDQAGVVRYVEHARTWENNLLKHQRAASIKEIICWDSSVYTFGVWWGKPSFKELLAAYRKTFYYGKPERVNTINEILNGI